LKDKENNDEENYFEGISNECRFFGNDSSLFSSSLALPDLFNDFPQFQI
jgi:hypothetical protein